MTTTTHPPRITRAHGWLVLSMCVYAGLMVLAVWALGFEPLSKGHPTAPLNPCELHGTLN